MTRLLTRCLTIGMLVIVLAGTKEIRSLNALVRSTGSSLPQCQQWGAPPDLYVSPAFSQDNVLFASGAIPIGSGLTRGWLKSTDRGISWSELPITVTERSLGGIFLSLNYPQDQSLYIAFETLLGRSTDSGQSLTTVPLPQVEDILSLAVVDRDTLFVGANAFPPEFYPYRGLFYSADTGQTWERLYQDGVIDVAVSPNYNEDHTVFMGIGEYHWNGGILKSMDGGHTWEPSREGLAWGSDGVTTDITFSPGYTQDHTMFAVSWDGLYKSIDEGAHWTRLAPLPESAPGTVNDFVISPLYPQDQTLWLSGYWEGNLVSTDGGHTWRSLPESVVPIAAGAYCLSGSLSLCRIELFGYGWDQSYNHYMYKSFNSGMTWQCLESDYEPLPMIRRAFLPMVSVD